MSATVLTLTIEPGALDARSSWAEFESLAVQMSREVPLRALEAALADAQERLIDSVCGPRWSPVRGLAAPFACPRCGRRRTSRARANGPASARCAPRRARWSWCYGMSGAGSVGGCSPRYC